MKGKVSILGDATACAAVEAFGPFPSPVCLPSLQDHHINITPDAPPSILCCTYPLSQAKEEFQTKYIQEQLDAGLI